MSVSTLDFQVFASLKRRSTIEVAPNGNSIKTWNGEPYFTASFGKCNYGKVIELLGTDRVSVIYGRNNTVSLKPDPKGWKLTEAGVVHVSTIDTMGLAHPMLIQDEFRIASPLLFDEATKSLTFLLSDKAKHVSNEMLTGQRTRDSQGSVKGRRSAMEATEEYIRTVITENGIEFSSLKKVKINRQTMLDALNSSDERLLKVYQHILALRLYEKGIKTEGHNLSKSMAKRLAKRIFEIGYEWMMEYGTVKSIVNGNMGIIRGFGHYKRPSKSECGMFTVKDMDGGLVSIYVKLSVYGRHSPTDKRDCTTIQVDCAEPVSRQEVSEYLAEASSAEA